MLPDSFETRVYLMFIHFSVMMIITKKKGHKFNQKEYDLVFYNIENNLRELGFGDVSVNKKMKDYVNLFYLILGKIENWEILELDQKKEAFEDLLNIKEDNVSFVKYFDKYSAFLSNNTLKLFTKDILEFKF